MQFFIHGFIWLLEKIKILMYIHGIRHSFIVFLVFLFSLSFDNLDIQPLFEMNGNAIVEEQMKEGRNRTIKDISGWMMVIEIFGSAIM